MNKSGFTIVEILIVIVVIAILAGITIVAYNGIQNRANDVAVQNDLRNFGTQMQVYKADNGAYPGSKFSGAPNDITPSLGIKATKSAYGLDQQNYTFRYCRNTTTDQYVLIAKSKSGNYFKITSDTGLSTNAAVYGWGVCDIVGLTQTNPSQNGLNNSTWDAWVN